MANQKISQLSNAAALTGTEQVAIVQSGTTVKTTTQDIANLGGGGGLAYTEVVYQWTISGGVLTPTLIYNDTGTTFVLNLSSNFVVVQSAASYFSATKTFVDLTNAFPGGSFGISIWQFSSATAIAVAIGNSVSGSFYDLTTTNFAAPINVKIQTYL